MTGFWISVGTIGWIMNIVFLAARFSTLDAIDFVQLLAIIGIPVIPIGMVMGYLQMIGL